MRRLRQLEEENRRLKGVVADQALDIRALRDVPDKRKATARAVKRQMAAEMIAVHHLSQRRACGLIGIPRRSFRHAPAEDCKRELSERLRSLGRGTAVLGCARLYRVIRREGLSG